MSTLPKNPQNSSSLATIIMVHADISTCTSRFCYLSIEGLPFIVGAHSYWLGVFGLMKRTSADSHVNALYYIEVSLSGSNFQ